MRACVSARSYALWCCFFCRPPSPSPATQEAEAAADAAVEAEAVQPVSVLEMEHEAIAKRKIICSGELRS